MRILSFISLYVLLILNVACYNQRPEINCETYEEAVVPEQDNLSEWEATGRGLHLSFGSKDIKYVKDKVPMLSVAKDENVAAWRGERVSLQAVLWSAYPVQQVECVWNDLISDGGDTIPLSNIETRFVRYVMSDSEFIDNESDDISRRDSCLTGDPLDNLRCINMEEKSVRPVWITIDIPRDINPGNYKSSLIVYSKVNAPQELRLSIDVLQNQLPPVDKWHFQVDMAFCPVNIAFWHKVELWSEEHFSFMEPYMDLLCKAGQKSVATSLFGNLIANSKDSIGYESHMIKWKKNKDGVIYADYENFDKWVQSAINQCNVTQIDCYALSQGKNQIVYLDERSNEIVRQKLGVDNKNTVLYNCFKNLKDHLEEKHWLDKMVIVLDNEQTAIVEDVKNIINKVDNSFKVEMYENIWHPKLTEDAYVVNVSSMFFGLKGWYNLRRQAGQKILFNLTSSDKFPNTFMHSPSAESVWFGWYAAAQEFDGLHIPAFNNWTNKIITDVRCVNKSSGSTHTIYPGPRSSVRFERLIEGIQDYEKILIIRNKLLTEDSGNNKEKLQKLDEVLSDFIIDRIPRESAADMVNNGQELLNKLSED